MKIKFAILFVILFLILMGFIGCVSTIASSTKTYDKDFDYEIEYQTSLEKEKQQMLKDLNNISKEEDKQKETIGDKIYKVLRNDNMIGEDIFLAEDTIFEMDAGARFLKKEFKDNIFVDLRTQETYYKLSDNKIIVIVNKISNNEFMYQLTKLID